MLAVSFTLMLPARAATITNFFTRFESTEGYSAILDLAGQQSWEQQGSGGNGLLASGLQGQSAYIGFAPPDPADDSLVLWRPINFNPLSAGYPIVKFSVLLNIIDSDNDLYDLFRWSIYNQQVDRLFSINLDNYSLRVSYLLDGTNSATPTSVRFVNDSNYLLTVTMNFAANRWSATLNNAVIATNEFITTTGAGLTLGDIDAVWLINLISYTNGQGQVFTTNAPGNNYMMFDNYLVTAEAIPVTPAQVNFVGRTSDGWVLRVSGQDGLRWAVEASTNLVTWTVLKTNQISGGSFDLLDIPAPGLPRRFYRARHVP